MNEKVWTINGKPIKPAERVEVFYDNNGYRKFRIVGGTPITEEPAAHVSENRAEKNRD